MNVASNRAVPHLAGKKLLRKLSQADLHVVHSDGLAQPLPSSAHRWWIARHDKKGHLKPVGQPDDQEIDQLLSDGVLEQANQSLRLTKPGRAYLKRALYRGEDDPHSAQHRVLCSRSLPAENDKCRLEVNSKESPLAWLATRRDRSGKPMIETYQYVAGERLRDDYERARLMNDVGSSWQRMGQPFERRQASGHVLNLTEAKLAAKQRLIAALEAVGPELSVILIDVCCDQLKLGVVEKRFDLPRRSGKVLLRMGLNQLARHYGLLSDDTMATHLSQRIQHWGEVDYRPVIDGETTE